MKASEVPSPCIQICQLDPQQVCTGCGRSLAEIAEWSGAGALRRQQINQAAQQRRERMKEHGKHPAQ